VTIPGAIASRNEFGGQPLKFCPQVAPSLVEAGDAANIPLFRAQRALDYDHQMVRLRFRER
jgi:hypothetical protein